MPLIAYKGAHGSNDFPLHYAFFTHLEKIGILDKFDFALDTWHDPEYCRLLVTRFPQLKLLDEVSASRRLLNTVKDRVGRAYGPIAYLDKFDAVCEGPGGRINEIYYQTDIFRLYPRVKRRAILFHSIEAGALKFPSLRDSIAKTDLIIARTSRSAENARGAGAKWVCESADVVFLEHPKTADHRPGIAVALRIPNDGLTPEYHASLRNIVGHLENLDRYRPIDFVRVEEPYGTEMRLRGQGSYLKPHTGLFFDNSMYIPFQHRRDAIISSRLHTTLVALLFGNRKILQYHIELGTNKTAEILDDIGLRAIQVHRIGDVNWPFIKSFLEEGATIPESEATAALEYAKSKSLKGMDSLLEWLDTIK